MTTPSAPDLAALRAKAQAVIDADQADSRCSTFETARDYVQTLQAFHNYVPAGTVLALLDRIEALERTERTLRMKLSHYEARCLCPDCRDKVPAGVCPRCHGQQAGRLAPKAPGQQGDDQ